MKLRQLTVNNFRGIQSLRWTIKNRINCLVGCGDSTKTTILEAIDLVLSPRWNIAFTDSDFHNCAYTNEISIKAVIGELPESILNEDKLGLFLLGWDEASESAVELEDHLEAVLEIELKVSASLEPEWTVTCLDGREPRHISSKDREAFGVTRLGESIDRHVTWSRGSLLTKMGENADTREFIASANRSAIKAIRDMDGGTGLHLNADKAEELAREMGVLAKNKFVPGLDSRWFGDSSASLSLHDGDIPLRMSGLGSRRLLAAAIQKSVLKDHGAILVDEVEHGLEPHRIAHLIRMLKGKSDKEGPQLFMTTHSPTAIAEIGAAGISVVSCLGGTVEVLAVSQENSFAGLVRARPESLLGRKVIVCEGPTEGGLCWAIDEAMQKTRGSFSLHGVVVVDGQGCAQGPQRAMDLAQLGYGAAFFGDSDEPTNPTVTEMEKAGVKVFLWPGGMSTEQRLTADWPINSLQEFIDLGRSYNEDDSIKAQVNAKLITGQPQFDLDVKEWLLAGGDEAELRKALGLAAKNKKGWFKNWTAANELGVLMLSHLMDGPSNDTKSTITDLADWAFNIEQN